MHQVYTTNSSFITSAKKVLLILANDDPDITVDYSTYLAEKEGVYVYRQSLGTYRLLIRYAVLKRIRGSGYEWKIAQFLEHYWARNDFIYETCLITAFSSFEICNGLEYDILRIFC